MKMRKLKTIVSLILTMIMILPVAAAVSCAQPDKKPQGSEQTGDPDEPVDKSFTFMGKELSEVTIVYAAHPYDKRQARLFTTDYDFFKLTAKEIAGRIEQRTGVRPKVQSADADPGEYEIVVGPVSREGCPDYSKLDIYDSVCKAAGNRLFVGGGYIGNAYGGNIKPTYCFASTYHAWDLIEEYLDQPGSNADIAADLDLKKTSDFLTVACVGDSITEGVGSTGWETDCNFSYPAILSRILWKDAVVFNYGSGGKTMRTDLTPYTATTQYSAARKYAKHFDYILLMLGTNDYLQDSVWTGTDNNAFMKSAKTIASAMNKKEGALTVIMNCPAYYGPVAGSDHVRTLQNGLPEYLKEQGINTSFFDMNEFTDSKVGRSLFPDQLHPNDKGYAIMAQGLSELIASLEKNEYTYTLPDYGEGATGKAPDVPIAEGAVSLLGNDLSKRYDIARGGYGSWNMSGAPYLLLDGNLFGGCRITNIEFPVSSCSKGNTLTVSVVKTDYPRVAETLSVHKLKADFSCGADWVKFAVDIEVPLGCTLAFGDRNDSMRILYIASFTDNAHTFFNLTDTTTGACLAFNVYGVPGEDYGTINDSRPDVPCAEGSTLLTSTKVSDTYPEIDFSVFAAWSHAGAPYFLEDTSLFSGKTVTDVRLPAVATPASGKFTVTLIRVSGGRIVERGESLQLTPKGAVEAGWIMFDGLDIFVPDGWTLGFGAPEDRLLPAYIPRQIAGYEFRNSSGTYSNAALVVEVYGK